VFYYFVLNRITFICRDQKLTQVPQVPPQDVCIMAGGWWWETATGFLAHKSNSSHHGGEVSCPAALPYSHLRPLRPGSVWEAGSRL